MLKIAHQESILQNPDAKDEENNVFTGKSGSVPTNEDYRIVQFEPDPRQLIKQKVYFEATVIASPSTKDFAFGIGLASPAYSRGMVGWDSSLGYHCDDGKIFIDYYQNDNGKKNLHADSYTIGDTVGCQWDLKSGEVRFSKNGKLLDQHKCSRTGTNWLPTITFREYDIKFSVNMGKSLFMFKEVQVKHPLIAEIEKLLDDEKTSDLTILVGESQVPFKAHRIILAIHSPLLKEKLFMSGAQYSNFAIPDVTPDLFALLIRYFYTGVIDITLDNLEHVCQFASTYQVVALANAIVEDQNTEITLENCFTLHRIGVKYKQKGLEESALKFMCACFAEISKSEAFLKMDIDWICEMLSRDDLLSSELSIFHFIECYAKFNNITDKNSLNKLFSCLRLPLIPPKDLLTVVKSSGHFTNTEVLGAMEQQMSSVKTFKPRLFPN